MKSFTRKHLQSFLLPIFATVVIPAIIFDRLGRRESFWGAHFFHLPAQLFFGAALILVGLVLLTASIGLFIKVGKGTLAPWYPTRWLVVDGVYSYTRNPMISGVLFILLGEAVVSGSGGALAWFLGFFVGNGLYFILSEEPGLENRFGKEYEEYKRNVPRWFPRPTPWKKECAKEAQRK
jgi:protein-S-isoprenylcysteine O-methyltransferase Ste14